MAIEVVLPRLNSYEKDIERLRKQYATRKTAVLEAATIKFRAIALGR